MHLGKRQGKALLWGNAGARGTERNFLVREHREIRLGGWGGTRVWRVLNAMLRSWALLWDHGRTRKFTMGTCWGVRCVRPISPWGGAGLTDWGERLVATPPLQAHADPVCIYCGDRDENRENVMATGETPKNEHCLENAWLYSLVSQVQRKP